MELVILLVVTFCILIVFKAFSKMKVNSISAKMMEATSKNDEQMFLGVINDFWTKWLVRPYYVNLSKIRFYIANKRSKQLEQMTDEILNSKIRNNEKVGLLNPLFSYFIENKNVEYANKLFTGLKVCFEKQQNAEPLIEELQLLMDVYVKPKEKRIKDLQKYISLTEEDAKEVWQYRLVTLYLNLNKEVEAKELLNEIKNTTKNMSSYESFIAKHNI